MGIISSVAAEHTANEILKVIEEGRYFADDADDILDKVQEKAEAIRDSAKLGYE